MGSEMCIRDSAVNTHIPSHSRQVVPIPTPDHFKFHSKFRPGLKPHSHSRKHFLPSQSGVESTNMIQTSYRPGVGETICPAADDSSTHGGSTSVRGRVRSPHISGGWTAAGSQRAYSLGSCATQPGAYTIVMPLGFILIIISIASPHRSCISGLNIPFCKSFPPQPFFSYSGLIPRILRTVYRYF